MKVLEWLLTLAAILGAAGCASLKPVDLTRPIELGPNQGILVVHVSTNFEVDRLEFGAGGVLENLAKGEHLQLFVASAGSHRWTRMELPHLRYRIRREDEWRFRVEPGRISYSGTLELSRSTMGAVRARTVDRSAMALVSLRERHPELLERHPLVYTGSGRNVFFEHLREAALSTAPVGNVP